MIIKLTQYSFGQLLPIYVDANSILAVADYYFYETSKGLNCKLIMVGAEIIIAQPYEEVLNILRKIYPEKWGKYA
jgi:hypothetical protein